MKSIIILVVCICINFILMLIGYYLGIRRSNKEKSMGKLNIYTDEDGQEYIFAEFYVGIDEIKKNRYVTMFVNDRK